VFLPKRLQTIENKRPQVEPKKFFGDVVGMRRRQALLHGFQIVIEALRNAPYIPQARKTMMPTSQICSEMCATRRPNCAMVRNAAGPTLSKRAAPKSTDRSFEAR
jgi:hypothetical protein